MERVQREKKLNSFLSDRMIEWKFNLSRARWWGGQFVVQTCLSQSHRLIGNGTLTFGELEDAVQDVSTITL